VLHDFYIDGGLVAEGAGVHCHVEKRRVRRPLGQRLSLWASNMRTGMMLPVAERFDRAGFEAVEIMSSPFKKKRARSQG
jgi:hypothetical protein